jgi:FixJ family two-component response regulator
MLDQQKGAQSSVAVIDDDQNIRQALHSLLRSVGLSVELFASVQEYLSRERNGPPDCLILDVRLPGRSGLDFFEEFAEAHANVPVVFISGHADVPMSVRAMKAGAVEFLTKPVRQQDLLDAIQVAIERGRVRREEELGMARIRAAFDTLTPREREVTGFVIAGLLNKQIAARMGISEATVKLHRGQAMRKVNAKSLAELVRMADKIEPPRAKE